MCAQQTAEVTPVSSLEEYLKRERLSDWPLVDVNQGRFEVGNILEDVRATDNIVSSLKEDCTITCSVLDELEIKLNALQGRLVGYADVVMTTERPELKEQPGHLHPPSCVVKSTVQSCAVSGTHQKQSRDEATKMQALVIGNKSRSVELTMYPGFDQSELTELPHGVEAPQLLDRVTKAQHFSTGFNRFWRRLFQSEASIAVLQDLFWWFFIDKYQKHSQADQKRIFNRISDSFVSLFNSVNPEIKDKFFMVYSDCLAQAVFASFWEAFLDSHKEFDDDFKQEIASVCSEWIYGVKSRPESHSHWNVQKLQPKSMYREQEADPNTVILMKDGKVNPQADFSVRFDLSEAQNSVDLANCQDDASISQAAFSSRFHKLGPTDGSNVEAPTRLAQSAPTAAIVSHQIGRGPEIERVQFNLHGRSPLVAHYLHMKGLTANETKATDVSRTELSQMQSEAPTYREVIKETKKVSKALHQRYHEISDLLSRELAAIEKQRIQHTREIESLKSQLTHHTTDMKIMSEKILDSRERDGNTVTRKPKEIGAGYVPIAGGRSSSSSSGCLEDSP